MAFHKPTYDFLDAYSTSNYTSKFFLSHPFLWKVSFFYPQDLVYSINAALEKSPEEHWRAIKQPYDYTDHTIGNILAARSITVPNENTQFDVAGNMNQGGFLPGYAVQKRTDFLSKNLVINFFDTEDDIEHLFFRPWMVAVGIDGLMLRNLLCPAVELVQYNNVGARRKGYRFLDVFPTNVEGYSLNYDNTDYIEKSITFGFKNYQPIPIFGDPRPVPAPPVL
tara:strand:+ start:1466 stop:2134 length:669 start_codon:yes stop_codon:yes gene_type:complete